jgi:hypothetical protein
LEQRLRARIDQVTEQRDLLAEMVARRDRNVFRRCPWCARPCYGRTCSLCRDLEELVSGLVA